jgi:hypothetical protein
MSRQVQVKKGSEIQAPDGPQTDGMIRMPAVVDMSDQICGTGRIDMKINVKNTDLASHDRKTSYGFCNPPPRR